MDTSSEKKTRTCCSALHRYVGSEAPIKWIYDTSEQESATETMRRLVDAYKDVNENESVQVHIEVVSASYLTFLMWIEEPVSESTKSLCIFFVPYSTNEDQAFSFEILRNVIEARRETGVDVIVYSTRHPLDVFTEDNERNVLVFFDYVRCMSDPNLHYMDERRCLTPGTHGLAIITEQDRSFELESTFNRICHHEIRELGKPKPGIIGQKIVLSILESFLQAAWEYIRRCNMPVGNIHHLFRNTSQCTPFLGIFSDDLTSCVLGGGMAETRFRLERNRFRLEKNASTSNDDRIVIDDTFVSHFFERRAPPMIMDVETKSDVMERHPLSPTSPEKDSFEPPVAKKRRT